MLLDEIQPPAREVDGDPRNKDVPGSWSATSKSRVALVLTGTQSVISYQILRNAQNKNPDNMIDAGSVSTHAISRFRTVAHCSPE